jgi:tRNA threonylcarbamoyladenosine biosynthesis protein TsaB
MPLILNIDTSTENALLCISKDENVIREATNNNQKDHAAFLQPAIKQLLEQSNYSIKQLDATSVAEGPGSYTGLRVGMATAKGLCYALKIPLITLSTLEVMALSAIENTMEPHLYWYCPMIDARRMEVFTAIFDDQLNVIQPPQALILEPNSFDELIFNKKIVFLGNGAKKFLEISNHSNLRFNKATVSASSLVKVSLKKFLKKQFSSLSNSEPLYIKQVF